MEDNVHLIEGDSVVDERGVVSFINDFNFKGVKRFYAVSNHQVGFIRGWHGHRIEAKYVTVLKGVAVIGIVKIDDWIKPSRGLPTQRFILSSSKPSVVYIPEGYANGSMTLKEETILIYFSTVSLKDSVADEVRFEPYYWNIWKQNVS